VRHAERGKVIHDGGSGVEAEVLVQLQAVGGAERDGLVAGAEIHTAGVATVIPLADSGRRGSRRHPGISRAAVLIDDQRGPGDVELLPCHAEPRLRVCQPVRLGAHIGGTLGIGEEELPHIVQPVADRPQHVLADGWVGRSRKVTELLLGGFQFSHDLRVAGDVLHLTLPFRSR
jgi:hypothetical protein